MTTVFSVFGPFEVPVYSKNKGHLITADCGREFCDKNHEIAERRGCYVFALRVGGGTTPYYVGRATKTFRQEVFTSDKLMKYVRCITDNIGTPVLYMVAADKSSGVKKNQICELEDFLIQNALAVNPDILNKKGKSALDWGIRGVFHGGQGKPSKSAMQFRQLMGISHPKTLSSTRASETKVVVVAAAKPAEG